MKRTMHRLLSLLMSLIILFTGILSIRAATPDSQAWMYKVDESILERMDNLSEKETLFIRIGFAADKNTFSEEYALSFLDGIEVPRELVISIDINGCYALVRLPKSLVFPVAMSADVSSLLFDGQAQSMYYNSRSAVVNKLPLISADDAVNAESDETARVYFKMPAKDNWYSDYSVYDGKYTASVYWDEGTAAPEYYPGYRMMADDYDQGVYYADIPEDVSSVIFGNGVTEAMSEYSPKARHISHTFSIDTEGALPGEFDTIPEGTADHHTFDSCIYVVNNEPPVTLPGNGYKGYFGDWYIYYGSGCYGSYAPTSDNFVSAEENCLNPDHFDSEGNHIGGAHIKAPSSPEKPLTEIDPELSGYYILYENDNGMIRRSNRLNKYAEGLYRNFLFASPFSRFRIVFYEDGADPSQAPSYPATGWYNENKDLITTSNDKYIYFSPDGIGDGTWYDGYIKIVNGEPSPTEPQPELDTAEPGKLFEQRFTERYTDDPSDPYEWWYYNELYYHKDSYGGIDWVLVNAYNKNDGCMSQFTLLGHRVLYNTEWHYPCCTGYLIYVVDEDRFYAIESGNNEFSSDGSVSSYDVWKSYDEYGEGKLLGDMDGDDELSILDVTIFQRCEAEMREFPVDDRIADNAYGAEDDYDIGRERWDNNTHGSLPAYYSDFNCDGERDITDATAIQRYLADM